MSRSLALAAACAALVVSANAQESQPAEPAQSAPGPAQTGTSVSIPGVQKLTITGQFRLRYENKYNFDFNRDAGASNDFFGQRVRLNIAPEFTDELSGLIQIQDVRNWGEEMSTLDDSADGFDLHQAFVQVGDLLGGAAKFGRQKVDLGSARLVSSLEWANQGRSFDGAVHAWDAPGEATVHSFFLQAREVLNMTNDDVWFAGAFATMHPGEDTQAELYAMWLHDAETAAGGTHNRLTLGGRLLQTAGELDLELEVATQVGEVDNMDIPIGETYAVAAGATYHVDGKGGPWAKVEVNFASGDDPTTSDVERFNTLFPFAHYYLGYMDLALWENIQHGTFEVGMKPCEQDKVKVAWHFFRAAEVTDRFGGPSGMLSPGIAGQSQTMGNEFDLVYTHVFPTERVKTSVQAGYGVFLPGPGAQLAAGNNDDLAHFFYLQGDLRF